MFGSAPAGRYRVGVDRAETCESGGTAAEPVLVSVEFAGNRRETRAEIRPGRFQPRVLEIDLPATTGGADD